MCLLNPTFMQTKIRKKHRILKGHEMIHFPHFRHNKDFTLQSKTHFFDPILDACHQLQFQKYLMDRFGKNSKNVNLGSKNVPFA